MAGTTPRTASIKKPIRLGACFWPGSYWIDVAYKKGWFEEAGLQVERIDTNADYFGSMDALTDGGLDTIGFTLYDFILANA